MPQDFSGQNFRGRSFKGQNLAGANFSGADIKSADFTGANLRNANFSLATAGLQKRWAIFLVGVSWLLSGISGFVSGYIVWLIVHYHNQVELYYTFFSLIVLTVFWIITIRRNIIAGLVAGTILAVIVINLGSAFGSAFGFKIEDIIPFVAGVTGAAAGFIGVTIAVAASIAVAGDLAVVGAGLFAFVATAGNFPEYFFPNPELLLSFYIGWRALKGNKTDVWLRSFANNFAASGGTSFRNADLTDANFTAATLKSTDFRKANLTRTCFSKTKKLDLVCPGTTYLQKAQVVSVLVTGQGQDNNFDRENLRGVNFQEANLVDASFIGVDLSQANLQDADLSRAKLVQTQLNGTDFTGATLTGAYIQDWGITTDTKFDGVRCEYVYMRLPTKENPDPLRKPDNNKEVFADGEFGDFIQPIFDTLDLYHNQGVDPRAIAISFKQLAENHPEADLRIVGMEVRGEDKFLLRAKTAATAEKSELSAEYFDTYNQIKSLPEREIKLLLAEKDNQIGRLENMVMTALERPSFYSNIQVEEVGTMTNNPGGFSVGGSVGGNVNNVQGDGNRAVQGDNNQAVLGDGNQVTQQNQVGADTGESLTKEDVVKLLAQLETLIQGAELPADTKEEVIEDLSAAKKATDKEEPNKQRALERLGTVAETLEKTSKGVEAGQKVWTIAKPIIVKVATWLGVAAGSHLLGL
ncbi:pentapeptide repeat-containing protein [Nostoc sp. WHI]|uniref:pentapeptide repeat-containing protein n=1 Tax=Nostoc sp. WHI TaxID=2650611 RepID=UPI0018C4BA5F|nr:pentapeptide repeat-containing protein [Nostoc sp. WHI]MBG1268090.1 hypothetical protein [Nostoc sp. WHI]